jgi:RNA polymerase sigma-70 factor (ECF subfamily)
MIALDESGFDAQTDREPSPATLAERHDSTGLVLRLLKNLPLNQQEVIRLKFQNGLSYEEISRVTHLTKSNVGFLLHTAIKALRQRLKAEAGATFFNAERRSL